MRPYSLGVWGAAVAALAALGSPAHAAWNNVFQVCCNNGSTPAPVVAAFGDACCAPQPACAPACTTRYVQRTYYEPVMTYKPQTYTEAVTTYQTRYFTEACTTVRYACAFNPCTCRYESVAQPVTSYRVRAKCCPVTSYLQRTCMVPVMSQRAVTMYEPVTSCCTTTTGPAVATLPPGAAVTPDGGAPGGAERREPAASLPPAPPGTESREPAADGSTPRYTPVPAMPPGESGFRRTPAPAVRFDRMASADGSSVVGRMTDAGRVPLSKSRVLFVSAEQKSEQYQATTDADGVFRTRLA
ncbi:MAG: hypothetical protein ACRC33_21315, partial [Gemmataceae bacterium]